MTSVSPDMRLGHSFGNDDDPPSPSAVSRPIDIPGSASYHHAWESNDYGASPANFGAYTPSYVGSFGSNQESAWGDREGTAAAYSAGASGDLFDDSKYEPEGYGANSPYLVMDDQSGFATLSGPGQNLGNNDSLFPSQDIHVGFHDVDPRQFSPRPAEVFATGSPGSSIGVGEGQPRSRASSMSSNPGAQSSPFMASAEFSGQPLHDQFTQLSFNQQLDPWGRQRMTSPPHDLSSPSQKPLSPPTLFIPPEPPAPALQPEEAQPAINLVPATPVSGGGAGGASQLPFQQMLANLNRQRGQAGLRFGRGNVATATARALPGVSSFAPNLGDSSAHTNQDAMTWSSIISASGQSQGTAPSALPQSRTYHHGYNVPLPDYNNPSTQQSPSLAMQMSNTNTLPHLPHQSQSDSSIPSNSGIHLPPFSSPQLHNIASFSETSLLNAPSLTRNRSKSDTSSRPPLWFDPTSSTSTSLSSMPNDLDASSSFNFSLTPAMQQRSALNNMGSLYASNDLTDLTLGLSDTAGVRRSNSDGGRSHKRSVKSEDFTSLRTPRLVPTSNADFIRSVTAADGSLAPVDPRSPPLGGPGPQRRRGSGSGHERNSSLSSLRATPYQRPSPHTSPGGSPHHSPTGNEQPLPGEQQGYMRVERPLVTTPATKTASANRRRAEASFTCPVPGCGSTFTRHFNLRGHLRSHNEERPFKCKWPGCEKGFARQHDCKRHEALHLNIRPYTCEGCQKTFARMDALNRHLRSEGGVDCQKLHQAAEGSPNSGTSDFGGQSSVPQTTGIPKIEQESSPWTQSGALVM